jgi:hypothetical protein
MQTPTLSTTLKRSSLVQFRQALYGQIFTHARAASFELVDALLLGPTVASFAELSQVPVFRRGWPSLYAAVNDGRWQRTVLEQTLVRQIPVAPVTRYALDSTVWPHPQARTLAERQYYRQAGAGGAVVPGHSYSLLAWVAAAHSSWALPVSSERIAVTTTAAAVGAAQVRRVCELHQEQAKAAHTEAPLVLIAADGAYGNHHFLGAVRDLAGCAVVARLRRDRVLYGAPGEYGGRGRRRKHGKRFAFKEPETWGEPDEEIELVDERWGKVRLRRWNGLHEQKDAAGQLSVVQVESHREREHPPGPLWLAGQGAATLTVEELWRGYDHRWPIEPSIRFRKQELGWTLPRFQDATRCDRWTDLVTVAQWELYLARELVADRPRPWQVAQREKTPARVKAGLGAVFAAIGTLTAPPQTRGKSPGWPAGEQRVRRERFPVVRKGRKKKKKAAAAAPVV